MRADHESALVFQLSLLRNCEWIVGQPEVIRLLPHRPSSESNPQFSGQVGTPTPTDTVARSCGPRARVAPIAISSFSSGLVPCALPGLQLFQPRSPSGPIPTSGTTDLCRTDGWPFLPRGGIPLFGKYDELPRECFE